MLRRRFKRPAALVAAAALALAALLFAGNMVTGASAATRSVIVQLKGDPVAVAKARAEAAGRQFDEPAYRRQIINAQDEFLNRLSAAGVEFSVASVEAPNSPAGEVANIAFRFNYVLNGVTLDVPEAAIPVIEAMSEVESVRPNSEVELFLDNAVRYTRAPSLYGKPPQIRMGDALQTGGFEGQGINIAVIDSGVDWTHPMFGSDPTPPQFGAGPATANSNRKVTYYMNYTAGTVIDDNGHGTHVAGIAAGYLAQAPGLDGLPLTADDVKIHGVAPQARVMGYKVLTGAGSGYAAQIIMAIEDAVQPFTISGLPKPVAHVINMSLGDTSNDPNGLTSIAADNATLAGVTVVAAAGNSGAPTPTNPTGEGTLGAPGAGRRVLTVGAGIDPGAGPYKVEEIGGRGPMAGYPFEGSPPVTADITANYVYCGLADTPEQVPDSVAGRVALIARGSTATVDAAGQGTGAFSNKAALAAAKGAVAAVIYNNVDGELTNGTVRKSTIPVVAMSKANGEYLRDAIGSSAFGAVSARQIRINKSVYFEPDMAIFSSKGPVNGFGMIKPDVVAPGVNVLSATVRVGGAKQAPGGVPPVAWMFDPTGYYSTSGTSMASPMVAGVAALVKQKNPTWTPSMIRAAVMNTATNLRRADGTPVADGTQTLNQQGAGLVDAFAAANASALMGAGLIDHSEGSPTARTHGVFVSSGPGNPDFLASHSFGAVPIAGVIGTATKSQTVTITDIRDGAGAGTYRLSSSAVRNGGRNVQISFTDAAGQPVSEVEVPADGSATFIVKVAVSGEEIVTPAPPLPPTQIEWYVTAARDGGGQALRMPFQLRAVRPTVSAVAPAMGGVNGNEFAGSPATDIDGSYQLTYGYAGSPAPAKFRVQESKDSGATWATLADVPSGQTAFDVSGRGNGSYLYRVVGLFSTEYGLIDGPASATRGVIVDRRYEADVTSLVQAAMVDGTVSFAGGVFQFDQTLKNVSGGAVFAPARFSVTSVSSRSGRVKVQNADNGGDGISGAAEFGYTAQLGTDQQLAAGETSAARRLQFANPAAEMFEFTATVRAHLPDAANASGASADGGSSGTAASTGSTSGGDSTSGNSHGSTLGGTTTSLRFVVNPLTRSVSVSLPR